MEGKVLMQNIVVGYVQVKLGEPGWRERYYEEKFGARTPEQIEEICRDVVSFSRQYFFYSTFVVFGITQLCLGANVSWSGNPQPGGVMHPPKSRG